MLVKLTSEGTSILYLLQKLLFSNETEDIWILFTSSSNFNERDKSAERFVSFF